MPRLLVLRNTLVLVGAYYVSAWVLIPLWIPLTKLVEGRVYPAGSQLLFWAEIFNMIPAACSAVLAGVVTGYFVETARPVTWAVVAGVFVGLCTWSSHHWYVAPTSSDLLKQGSEAAAVGTFAFMSCWMVQRRRLLIARSDAPA